MKRFGRIIKQPDELFSQNCSISSGAIILQRQPRDDYVRMRVPDTDCPPLPRPNAPLDDGQADVAEPNRWQVAGTPNTSDKWLLKQQSDEIRLLYGCYSGDFVLEVVSNYVSKTGSCAGDISIMTWDGVALIFELGTRTFGIGVCWSHHFGVTEVPWGGSEGRSYLWFVAQGSSLLSYAELMIPSSQTNTRYRVQRNGSNIRFGVLNSLGNWQYSEWHSAGSGLIQPRWEGIRIWAGGVGV